MRLFWQVTRLSLQRQVTYRAATLAGLATNFFFGLLRAAVMVALFGSRQQVEGFSLQDAITYTGLAQAIISFLSLFSWYEVSRSVYTGEIAVDLLKPMGYFLYWMAQDLGRALVQLLMRGLPILAVYSVFFKLTVPSNPMQWLALVAALFLGWMVSFSFRFLVNLAAFWVTNAVGIGRFAFTLAWFLSGFLMPIRFFPEWFARLCYLTPFPHAVNTIIEVYLGLVQGPEILMALLGQAAWVVGMIAVGQIVLHLGVRRLVIQGG